MVLLSNRKIYIILKPYLSMNISERNKKVALSRWKKVFENQNRIISNSKGNLTIKAGLCGFLAGDGSVQVRKEKTITHHQLDFFPDDKEMVDVYCSFIKKLYGKSPAVKIKGKMHIARISLKYIVLDLLKECNFGIHKWTLPERLFKLNKDKAIRYWLRGFFSAEGYVNPKYVKTQSVNIVGLRKVSKLLNYLGIVHGFYLYKSDNPNHSQVGMIFINRIESRKIFLKKIGFWHSKKTRLLEESLNL